MMSFCISIFLLLGFIPSDTLETIYPGIRRGTLENLNDKNSERGSWKLRSYPMSKRTPPFASSSLVQQGNNNYGPSNTEDFDLRTAWVFCGPNKGIGEYIEFRFDLPEGVPSEEARKNVGKFIIFNGYCKSVKTWEENSRVKKLKVYYNDKSLCYIELQDIFFLQRCDLRKFFKGRVPDKDARLRFEIVEVYKGRKYDDVAISEILQ